MKKLLKLSLNLAAILFALQVWGQTDSLFLQKKQKFVDNEYWHQFSYNTAEWQMYLDSALAIEPLNAHLWEQKAMPNFKNGNYLDGMRFLNKAVELDSTAWLGYRGFMKCIFLKDYKNALTDLMSCYVQTPFATRMDHTYSFWVGLCHLKLNDLDLANYYLQQSINQQLTKGKDWVHYVDWFYWTLTKLKQNELDAALEYLENALAQNPEFPDALYYKAQILYKQKHKDEAKTVLLEAQNAIKSGYRMNEDNEFYANYPFQITIFEVEKFLEERF